MTNGRNSTRILIGKPQAAVMQDGVVDGAFGYVEIPGEAHS